MAYHSKIKRGDTVMVRIGKHKGTIAKVEAVQPARQAVLLEGIGKVKRHVKPSQADPKGGTRDIHIALPISKVSLIVDGKTKTSRVGVSTNKAGEKVRVARQLKNKEIA